MNQLNISVHDVNCDAFESLTKHMAAADGVSVTANEDSPTIISGVETEIQLRHDATANRLDLFFAQVPKGLETYYWGHALQQILIQKRRSVIESKRGNR